MAVLPLHQIVSGMVLSKDVLDMSGRLLLGRAAVINNKHLKILKTWGITEVTVLDLEETAYSPCNSPSHPFPNSQFHQQAKETALQLFPNDSHPLNQLILTYATRTLYRRLELGVSMHVC